MGAFGTGVYDNDDAMDYGAELSMLLQSDIQRSLDGVGPTGKPQTPNPRRALVGVQSLIILHEQSHYVPTPTPDTVLAWANAWAAQTETGGWVDLQSRLQVGAWVFKTLWDLSHEDHEIEPPTNPDHQPDLFRIIARLERPDTYTEEQPPSL